MIHILTDSTSCLPPALGRQKGITVVSHLLNFSDHVYREWLDLAPDAFIAKLADSGEIPKSLPASVDDFVETLRPLVDRGEPVICLAASREVSQTFDHIQEAARRFPNADIRILDTRVTSSLLGSLALLAADWAAAGESAESIEQRVRDMIPEGRIYFLVPTLEYLSKGGRIGGAAALLGTLLQLKPILTLRDGQVDRYGVTRTYKHGMIKLQELVVSQTTLDSDHHIVVTHAGALEQGQALVHALQDALRLPAIPIYDIPPSIVCNTGPGTLGVSFFIGTAR
jgi:DegV family protein with EDD domain